MPRKFYIKRKNKIDQNTGLDVRQTKKDAKDPRNFKYDNLVFGAPALELPTTDWEVAPVQWIKNQFYDTCVGASGSVQKEYQEKIELSEDAAWILCKKEDGNTNWGTSLRQFQNVLVKYGIPEKSTFPHISLEDRDKFLAQPITQTHLDSASKHKAGSYWDINQWAPSGSPDYFDRLCDAMYREKQRVHVGSGWWANMNSSGLPTDRVIRAPEGSYKGGHAYVCNGWKYIKGEKVLDCVNSWGSGYGDNGHFYLTRAFVNEYLFSGYITIDIQRSLAELLNKYSGQLIKPESDNKVYIVSNGGKYWFNEEDIFRVFYKDFSDVNTIDPEEVDIIPDKGTVDLIPVE